MQELSNFPIFRLEKLSKVFKKRDSELRAVDELSLDIFQDEILALVGESGCGKTTLARLLLALEKPSDGKILYKGRDLSCFKREESQEFRKDVKLIFQDALGSLDRKTTVQSIIAEALRLSGIKKRSEIYSKTVELLEMFRLDKSILGLKPGQLSVQNCQVVSILRTMASSSRTIVMDEPVSFQDIFSSKRILDLLLELKAKFSLTYIFICHNLDLVRYFSTRVVVMYLGNIVEIASREQIFKKALHPYTKALLASSESLKGGNVKTEDYIKGDISLLEKDNRGCPFYPRCPKAFDDCKKNKPKLKEYSKGHFASCFLLG